MKSTLVLLFVISVYLICSCNGKKKEVTSDQKVSKIEVAIEGMTCTGCEQTIQRNVGKLEGVKSVTASFTTGNAVIEYNPDMTDTLEIKDAISGSGYTVKKFKTGH